MHRPVNPYRLARRFTGTVNGHVVHRSLSLPGFSKGRRGDERKSGVLAFSIHRPVLYSHQANSSKKASSARRQSLRRATQPSRSPAHHGGRGESNRLRGGGAATPVAAAEAGGRRQDRAPASTLHAPVVRCRLRRQRRGDAEAAARGGSGGRHRGHGPGRALLRVAGRLHRELPQEPGLRDHLRPPRHGCVRGGGGGGGDDGGLAVQEAGHGADRGGHGRVPGRGGLRRHVRVGVQRARQDRAGAHHRMQLLRRLAHRQRRRRALRRRPAAGLVRRRLNSSARITCTTRVDTSTRNTNDEVVL